MALFQDAAPRLPSTAITLPAGLCYVPPPGWYWYGGSLYANLQRYDPVAGLWRFDGDGTRAHRLVYADGVTLRIANPTGCAVAAVVTNAGSGYTSAPTVTEGAGGSVWQAIVGGAVSTAAVIGAAGSGYLYPPMLWIEQPPNPGTQAGGYTTITNGTISAVTITTQGSGYVLPPNVVVIPDWRDTAGSGGQVSVSLTGAQTVTGLICTNWGNPITSGTVPLLSFSGGGGTAAAATTVMDWCITAVSITTPGAGYVGSSLSITVTGAGGYVTATPAYLGGFSGVGLMRWRPAAIDMIATSGGGFGSTGAIIDGGRYQGIPTPSFTGNAPSTTTGVLAFTMGGNTSTDFLIPAQQ